MANTKSLHGNRMFLTKLAPILISRRDMNSVKFNFISVIVVVVA